ncbi:hypothetical protein ABZ917_17825 [Nonomuraea wenchangensis]
MGGLDKLEVMAAFANDAANGTLLGAIAIVALILAAVGVVWLRDRLNRLPSKQQRQDDAHDDDPDAVEQFIADALKYEADQQWLRRGRRREGRDQ